MPSAKICIHGITPKYKCEKCVRENARIRAKRYGKLHPERLKESHRKTWQKYRNQYINHHKEWYRKNQESVLKQKKEHYYANINEMRTRSRKFYQDNRERILIEKQVLYEELRDKIDKKMGAKCVFCGRGRNETIISYHEIYGREHPYYGLHGLLYVLSHIDDFITLCFDCHRAIHFIARRLNHVEQIFEYAKRINGKST
jgi:hypothetical protein